MTQPGDRGDDRAASSAALARALGPVGLVPLAPLAETAPPGGGYHYGGSVPMRERPGCGEADTLGRPCGTQRIHVVDSSCFPSVPAGTDHLPGDGERHRIATAASAQARA